MQTFIILCTIVTGNTKTAFFLFVLLCHRLKTITSDGTTVPTLKYTYSFRNKYIQYSKQILEQSLFCNPFLQLSKFQGKT